jgi:uncharacterized protein YqgV (UPF0045/DUF77 family)
VVKYLESEKIPHELTDMGTLVQGQPAAWHELPCKKGVQRVMTHIAIDDRRDQEVFLGDKKKSVKARLK